jgi:hypothetical protein
MVFYAEPVGVNHGVLYGASGCESWCAIRSQWLYIMVCYTEPMGCQVCCAMPVNHGELCLASGCESWFTMLCQWL